MAINAHWYGVPIKNQYDGTAVVDWDTDTIKCALTTSAYVPNLDTHDFFNDVTNEITGTGYTAGGVTLGTKSVTYDTTANEIRLISAAAQWTSSSFTARFAVFYKSTGTSSTSPLICYLDMDADQTVSSGTFTITPDATGWAKITVA